MAVFSQSCFNFTPVFRNPLRTDFTTTTTTTDAWRRTTTTTTTTSSSNFVVLSSHSNPKMLNSYRSARHRQSLSPYYDDDDDDDDLDDGDSDLDEEDESDDDLYSDDEYSELDEDMKTNKSAKVMERRQGKQGNPEKDQVMKSLQSKRSLSFNKDHFNVKNKNQFLDTDIGDIGELSTASERSKMEARKLIGNKYPKMLEEIDMDAKWIPLLDYLSSFGLKESHFIQMYDRNMLCLQYNVVSAQERLDYLMSVGVKHRDIRRILLRQPQILGYTVENNLKPHVKFLADLGIPSSKIGQIIANSPSLFSYSVENSLKPTVRYLVEEVGIKETFLGKVVQLSPQILVQRIDVTWNARYTFLSKELGAPKDSIVKMVTKHPQFLHYSIEDGLLPRINFLRSIGMCDADILKVLTSLTQVLSLSLEDNLKPKYRYLVNELNNKVQSLNKYPTYLSLSLDQRIRPRHRFLVSLKKVPKGPFPLSSLVPTDESFCQQWAGTSLDTYLEFRQKLLLSKFAKKYERKR